MNPTPVASAIKTIPGEAGDAMQMSQHHELNTPREPIRLRDSSDAVAAVGMSLSDSKRLAGLLHFPLFALFGLARDRSARDAQFLHHPIFASGTRQQGVGDNGVVYPRYIKDIRHRASGDRLSQSCGLP